MSELSFDVGSERVEIFSVPFGFGLTGASTSMPSVSSQSLSTASLSTGSPDSICQPSTESSSASADSNSTSISVYESGIEVRSDLRTSRSSITNRDIACGCSGATKETISPSLNVDLCPAETTLPTPVHKKRKFLFRSDSRETTFLITSRGPTFLK